MSKWNKRENPQFCRNYAGKLVVSKLFFEIAMKYLLLNRMGSVWGPLILANKNLAQEKVKEIAWKK